MQNPRAPSQCRAMEAEQKRPVRSRAGAEKLERSGGTTSPTQRWQEGDVTHEGLQHSRCSLPGKELLLWSQGLGAAAAVTARSGANKGIRVSNGQPWCRAAQGWETEARGRLCWYRCVPTHGTCGFWDPGMWGAQGLNPPTQSPTASGFQCIPSNPGEGAGMERRSRGSTEHLAAEFLSSSLSHQDARRPPPRFGHSSI